MLNARNAPRFGTDPEGFFQKGGQIIGSEKILPKGGISSYSGRIVRDGVQFELNPFSGDVMTLRRNIAGLFGQLRRRLDSEQGVSINFNGLVEVSEEELNSLSPDTRVLGCMPSNNAYQDRPITVDPVLYRKRSSGGHIHIGTADLRFMEDRRRAVPLFDIFVGNTVTLLDRDPGAAERRENYGRAGEFRLPNHGLEYRTTSNFWLRDPVLMDFVFGLAHIAYDTAFQSFNGNQGLWNDVASAVDIAKFVKAIDGSDFDLAMKNFKRLVPLLRGLLPETGFVLTPTNIDAFIAFAESAERKGIETYFPTENIVSNWMGDKHISFNQYLAEVVR